MIRHSAKFWRRKKWGLGVLASGGLLFGLLFALQPTGLGYVIACMFGLEYYSEWAVVPGEIKTTGELPPSFHLRLVTPPSKYGTVIPLLLTYRLSPPVGMYVDFRIAGDLPSVQHLELERLELALSDGAHENLLGDSPSILLPIVTNHTEGVSKYYRQGRPYRAVAEQAACVQIHFDSYLLRLDGTATLTSEGTIHLDGDQADKKFRQVAVWTITRKKGVRKPWIP